MKSLRRIFAVVVLLLAVTATSLAGDMDCGLTPPPATTSGVMDTGMGLTATAGPSLAAALDLLRGVLALF